MINTEYKIAYSEVLEILKYISKEEFNKIPKDMLEMFRTNASTEKQFVYDPNKTLQEQNVSEIARIIIAILFRDYWATENQKQKILDKQNFDRKKLQEERYNTENLFKKHRVQQEENDTNNEVAMVKYKEPLFKRIINKIKSLFINRN